MASMTRVAGGVMWLYPSDADRLEGEVARCISERNSTVILFDTEMTNGFDTAGGRWVTFCDKHSTVCNHTSKRNAIAHLKCADWCEACCAGDQATVNADSR